MPFSDLNDDVLRHIALFLAPPYAWRYHLTSASCMREHTSSASASHSNTHTVSPTVFPELPSAHWRTVSLPVGSYYDAAAFRHACRATMRVVPLRRECVEINEGEFPHWLGAREEMLEDIKRLRLVGIHHASYASAQASFNRFCILLARLPALKILELESPFCYHEDYGFGYQTDDGDTPLVAPVSMTYPKLRILSTELECSRCCSRVPKLFTQRVPGIERLRIAFSVRGMAPRVVGANLTTLILKTAASLAIPSLILRSLSRCTALRELFVSYYDLSRKADVITEFNCASFLRMIPSYAELRTLDMCLSAHSFAALANFSPEVDASEDLLEPSTPLVMAASHLLASVGVQRGWWWHRVVDLDYGQLQGYRRLAWEARPVDSGAQDDAEHPSFQIDFERILPGVEIKTGFKIVLAEEPAWLHPMVVRNTDAQGTSFPMPDEQWG